jgi:hypothetical protein
MSTDLQARANLHRPQTLEEVRATVRRMLGDGMSDYGVAVALGIAVEQVRRFAVYDQGEHQCS